MEQFVIIGAGQAGSYAAVAARQAGFGGRIVLIGNETARPYERPPLSKATITEPEIQPPSFFHALDRYAEHGIDLRLSASVREIDITAGRVHVADESIPFDRLLLATGGRARALDVRGGEHALTLRSYDDALRIRERLASAKRVICIGAGVIGLEIASSARKLGREVIVIEAGASVMGRCVSQTEADFIEKLHLRAGVEFRFGTKIVSISKERSRFRVDLEGDGHESADLVVAGVGMERNIKLAETAGIKTDNGIMVDEYGQTSVPGVLAAGDVTAFWHPHYERRMRLESWYHAQNHGIATGRTMAGDAVPYNDIPRFWTDQHGVNIQVAGFPAESVRTLRREGRSADSHTALYLDAEDRLVGVTAINNGRDMRPAIELIRSRRRIVPAYAKDSTKPLTKAAEAV